MPSSDSKSSKYAARYIDTFTLPHMGRVGVLSTTISSFLTITVCIPVQYMFGVGLAEEGELLKGQSSRICGDTFGFE